MTYNLENELDRRRFEARVAYLTERRSLVDLTERSVRTGKQNAYVHACLGVVAMELGESLQYVKQEYFKRLVNPDLFVFVKPDRYLGEAVTLRSTAELTKEQMSTAITRFKRWARDNGMIMPEPGDESLLQAILADMARMNL